MSALRVGLLGHGRFGAALAALVEAAGGVVRAFDPAAAVPAGRAVASPTELAAAAEVLVLAVPVHRVRAAAAACRPELAPGTLVLHVCSVQAGPDRDLAESLGAEVEWCGCHPLFGPAALARGEPLRAVVCPNPLHPGAAARARAFWERLGCEVEEQEAAAHDRAMAYSHALAFFVAKGLLDLGELERLAFVPPSFQSMLETVDSVRADAGHLFLAIERANPFAAEARQRLLEALADVHARLDRAEAADASRSTELFPIPDLGARAPELARTRDAIDALDAELIELLARRARLARRAGGIKAEHGHGVRDPHRERELLAARRRLAVERGLDPDAVERVFAAVLRFSRELQGGGSGA
ncbi:MAG: prephenate dehydrogenase/arogenate dehydrogenase family protein [Planctomycetota bacterium]|nr:MAG: prephenate dehydrogenase/arogenate dehydrogenase family protein [Planctomycetota bacterium]